MSEETRQATIIHLSDLHFGGRHRFNTPTSVNGDAVAGARYPSMLDHLENHLKQRLKLPNDRLVLGCITGDLTTFSSKEEFEEAEQFVRGFSARILEEEEPSRVCIVPGNHDLEYAAPQMDVRWANYLAFYRTLYPKSPVAGVDDLIRLDRYPGVIVLSLNTAKYVEKDKEEQNRGNLDADQLKRVGQVLGAIPAKELEESIRIAVMHHHPILIPALAETGRKYDAIHNSGLLLNRLRKYGFHVILHGHKHNPHVFSDDMRAAFSAANRRPMLVVAGGSVGSTELPESVANTYNVINIKWHPAAAQARVAVDTFELITRDEDGDLPPSEWEWRPVDAEDRSYYGGARLPRVRVGNAKETDAADPRAARAAEIARLRGNMPVVEVFPSLQPDQAYEARVWIVAEGPRELPEQVIWSIGEDNYEIEVAIEVADGDTLFCSAFSYWKPVLIQARIRFRDGTVAVCHLYGRVPATY
jgi:3',5'-cyclic AMP phosphodiesterase CpdA